MSQGSQYGMQTFDQALYDLYSKDEITYEDALRHADSANQLRLMIKLGREAEATEDHDESDNGGGDDFTLLNPDDSKD